MKGEFLFLSGPTCLVSSLNYSPVDHLVKHHLLSAIELLDPAVLSAVYLPKWGLARQDHEDTEGFAIS